MHPRRSRRMSHTSPAPRGAHSIRSKGSRPSRTSSVGSAIVAGSVQGSAASGRRASSASGLPTIPETITASPFEALRVNRQAKVSWQAPTRAALAAFDTETKEGSDTCSVRTATTIREFFTEEDRWADVAALPLTRPGTQTSQSSYRSNRPQKITRGGLQTVSPADVAAVLQVCRQARFQVYL